MDRDKYARLIPGLSHGIQAAQPHNRHIAYGQRALAYLCTERWRDAEADQRPE